MKKPKSQNERILSWLRSGKKLNPIQALHNFGCFRLSARVRELKNEGHAIASELVEKDGKRYARYYMV